MRVRPLGQHAERIRGIAERGAPLEHVGKGVARDLNREDLATPSGDPDIQISWISGDPFHGATLPPELAAHDAHACAVVVDDLRDVARRDVLSAASSS
jgi:hypothetical protein